MVQNSYMSCISELGRTLLITDWDIRDDRLKYDLAGRRPLSEQETLETYLDDFQEYVTDDNKAEYDEDKLRSLPTSWHKKSANNDNEAALASAGKRLKIADYSSNGESIAAIRTNVSENADVAKGTACSGLPDGNRA